MKKLKNLINSTRKKEGFTLIELLVTLAIIALLLGIVIFSIRLSTGDAKIAVNKITNENLAKAAILYAKEYKVEDKYWYDEKDGTVPTGNKFSCTTIKQLKEVGFLKGKLVNATTNEEIKDDTTIKIVKDPNEVILAEITQNSKDCDMGPPDFDIVFTGTKYNVDGKDWYNGEVEYKISPIVGMSGIKEYKYTVDINGSKKNITNVDENFVAINKIDNTVSGTVTVCASGKNGNDVETESPKCETINMDNVKITNPTLIANDGKTTGKWHNAKDFDNNGGKIYLNISGGGNPKSGKYYVYGTSSDKIDIKVENNKIDISNSHGIKYYVKTCYNWGVCSNPSEYEVKIDKVKPTISNVNKSTNKYYVTNLNVTADAKDELSGLNKYKIVTSGNYVDSGWSVITPTTDLYKINKNISSRGTYYVWVQDQAGNYNVASIKLDNIATLLKTNLKVKDYITSTISGRKSIPGILEVKSVTVDNGEVRSYRLDGTTVTVNLSGGSSDYEYDYETSYRYADSRRADEDEYCERYYCPDGGDLDGKYCTGDTFKEFTDNTVDCYCNNKGEAWTTPDQWPRTPCPEGYTKDFIESDLHCNCDTERGRIFGWMYCEWDGDYRADCKSYETEYSCDSDEELDGRYCYSCDRDEELVWKDREWQCEYEERFKVYYWEYNVTIEYYK